jgi:hypothetical protein
MPVVRHRLNFSELIVKAADQITKQKERDAKYAHAIETHAKRRASTASDALHERATNTFKTHSMLVSLILVCSSKCRQFLNSNFGHILLSIFMIAAFITLSAATSQSITNDMGDSLVVLDLAVDAYFLTQGLLKTFVLFSTVVVKNDIGEKLQYNILFVDSGIVEIVFSVISIFSGESQLNLWCRLLRLLFISTVSLKHIPHIDVLLVCDTNAFITN